MKTETILPGNTLTVIIRDDSPFIHCNGSPAYRSVQIVLAPEQVAKLRLRLFDGEGRHEVIDQCFIEPPTEF